MVEEAFFWLTNSESNLEALAARKRRRDFAADPWPEEPSISGLLEMAERVFEVTEELGRQKPGPKPKPREERIRGKPGRPLKYTTTSIPTIVREIQTDLDDRELHGQRMIATVVRRHLMAARTPAHELKAETRRLAKIVYYLRRPRRKTPPY